MFHSASRVLHGLLKASLVIGVLAVALLALLLAWWIALLAVGTWLLVTGVHRLLRGSQPAARAAAATIEGEYRVEHHSEQQETLTIVAADRHPPKD